MSPIGFYGIFIYYKNMAKKNKGTINQPNKNVILPPKIDIDAILGRKKDNDEQQKNNNINKNNNNFTSNTKNTKHKAINDNYSKQSKYKNDNNKKDIKEKK